MTRRSPTRLLCLFVALNVLRIGAVVIRLERDMLQADGDGDSGRRVSRHRRAPAVWGEPAPDYSAVRLFGEPAYIYALLFVDAKISEHYAGDTLRLKSEIMKLAEEANRYFYQVALRLIVVDVIETMRSDLTLFAFEQMRDKSMRDLPYHNFAAVVSYRHAGGLAFVSGMCSAKSVMLTGFYPHNPEAMGSIFFHEVAHLIGVPHSAANETLRVPECACAPSPGDAKPPSSPTPQPRPGSQSPLVERNDDAARPTRQPRTASGCLRIPGFDHDCTLQWMANLVERNRCLRRRPLTADSADEIFVGTPTAGSDGTSVDALYASGRPASVAALRAALSALPLCGNGAVERGEQCDCGLPQMCTAWNCDPTTCTRLVPLWILYLCTVIIIVSLVTPLVVYVHLRRRYHNPRDFCWAQAVACYARLPRGTALPRRLCGWRCWCQDSGRKWTADAAPAAQRKFLQQRLSAGTLARDGDAPKSVVSAAADVSSSVASGGYSYVGRAGGAVRRLLDGLRAGWPLRPSGKTSSSRAKMKLMRIFAPSDRRGDAARPASAEAGTLPYATSPTPICAWSNVWPPPAPPLLVLSRPGSARADETPRRPRLPPPPPPLSGARSPGSVIVIQPLTTTDRANKRPARPPPPRPASAASSCGTSSVEYSKRSAARQLLPPPPPPPPAASLSRPSFFAPPDVPCDVRVALPRTDARATAAVTLNAAVSGAKLAPVSILSDGDAPSLLQQIEADAARQFADKLTARITTARNDVEEDRYSISHKFADFDDDFQSDCDEQSFSAAG